MLLMIVAAELALVLSRRNAVYWLCLLLTVYSATRMPFLLGLGSFSSPPNLTGAVIDSYMMLVWMVVSFGVGCLAAVERLGRIELATAHAKLLSTQHLLTDTLRISERVRIAQNLHDAIGHHLTALNLHLELGLRQVGSQAVESFYISRGLAQSMLSEIRHIVNIEREDRVICLREALELLCSGIPTSLIALSYDPALELDDPILVHTIFRSVQEAITNAVRHSAASNIEVTLVKQSACVKISVHDNGKGAPIFVEGNGLKGMRERIEELSGTLVVTNQPPDGFALHFLFPLPGEQS
jgi:two-component system, NarL family, sensor histidine kinase DesK